MGRASRLDHHGPTKNVSITDMMNISTNETHSQSPAAGLLYCVFLTVAIVAGCTQQAPAPPPPAPASQVESAPPETAADVAKPWAADRLVGLLSARLKIMHDVARWKWHAGRPIEDPEREELLLAAMEKQATEQGPDPKQVRAFFAAQLTASKLVQQADFERWKASGPPPTDGPDLQRDLRPQIDQLNRDLLDCWRDCTPRFAQSEFRAYLLQKATEVFSKERIAEDVQRAALAPLQETAAKSE